LPPEIVAEIAERTDGVPLFVEELTKAVVESGAQAFAALSLTPHEASAVPATLHALLMARLDRLEAAAKEVAQKAAVIGRHFSYGLLASITDLPVSQLREALDQLTNAGLLFVRGTPPEASYLFKHALVQDAAYGTLVSNRRQLLHAQVAAALEESFPEIVQAQPALMAQHCARAGLAEKAVAHWLKAGRQALARSAMTEAVAQLRKGLDVLAGLPDGPWRQQQELDLHITLRPALAATKGWATAEVAETLARARVLAEWLDRAEHLVLLIWGQWGFHSVRAEHRLALAVGEQIEKIGKARNNTAAQLFSRFLQGASRLQLGDFVAARALLERSMDLADPAHRPIGQVPADSYAGALAFLAMTLAYLGYLDQARSRMDEALSEARQRGRVLTLVLVLDYADLLNGITGSPMVHWEEFLTLSAEHGLRHYLAWGLIHRGRSLIGSNQAQQGLALLAQGLADLRATGCVTGTARVFTWLAKAHAVLGQSAEELNCLTEAARIVETTEERVYEAEVVHQVPGDLLNAAGDRSRAERQYRQAIAVAERQSARLFQLRASTSLARLWRDQGKCTEARNLLSPIYNWFTEGFDAPDLEDAKALLDELDQSWQ
jgi:tetratricopeptide (TPR) repeat protein